MTLERFDKLAKKRKEIKDIEDFLKSVNKKQWHFIKLKRYKYKLKSCFDSFDTYYDEEIDIPKELESEIISIFENYLNKIKTEFENI